MHLMVYLPGLWKSHFTGIRESNPAKEFSPIEISSFFPSMSGIPKAYNNGR